MQKFIKIFWHLVKQYHSEILFMQIINASFVVVVSFFSEFGIQVVANGLLLANVLFTLYLLRYQYDKGSVNFYYSLPYSRRKLLFSHQFLVFCNGIISILIGLFIYKFLGNDLAKTHVLLVFVSVLFAIIASSLMISLSTSKVESTALLLLFWLFFKLGMYSILHYVSDTLNGFPLTNEATGKVPYLFTFSYVGNFPSLKSLLIYLAFFVILSIMMVYGTYQLVFVRKVEYNEGTFGEARLYSVIKIYLVGTLLIHFIGDIQFFQKNLKLIHLLSGFMVGLFVYCLLSIIHKKSFSQIGKFFIQYCVVVVFVMLSLFLYTKMKAVAYETKGAPKHVSNVDVCISENQYYPTAIRFGATTQCKIIKNSNEITYVKDLHAFMIQQPQSNEEGMIIFKYNTNQLNFMMRGYSIIKNPILTKKLLKNIRFETQFHKIVGTNKIRIQSNDSKIDGLLVPASQLGIILEDVLSKKINENNESFYFIRFVYQGKQYHIPFGEKYVESLTKILVK